MAGLIDTNILVLRRSIDPAELPDLLAISTITLAELSAGPHNTDDPIERARRLQLVQQAEATFDPLPFDVAAARIFGMANAHVLAAGRKPRRRIADLMIASVAAANLLPLYTTNPADFVGLEDLVTVVPVSRPDRPVGGG
ncbi:type II toxin-antitoxin system VapC family toxin [Nonomuraea typhae]|uniref:Type II toxin-antitoxin system VapC family toxin n=1 Tax=Nonomuraea typhae TaxID=2603600 RepID=A0ABW7YYC7_9ACTN